MNKIIFGLFIMTISFINADQIQCNMATKQLIWNENALLSEIESGYGEKVMIQMYAKEALKSSILMLKSCDALTDKLTKDLNERIKTYKELLSVYNEKQPNNTLNTQEVTYIKCQACHGVKAEKKALGSSQIIAGWTVDRIKAALYGYKNDTYGGSMKGIMKAQVATMSDADIDAVSKYISSLKE